jgi:L-ascorbate metabolism protein UlaG (beta-lactamase superfamily)
MSKCTSYLKANVQAEPLVNRWYAHPMLVAPATAALNLAQSHLKIMRSYVAAPEVHAAAVKNPALAGGPFIDCDSRRVAEIKALADALVRDQAALVAFAEDVRQLFDLLDKEGTGASLEPLYARVPERLKGFVELVYGVTHHPSVRFIEPLLYRSPYYDRGLQSLLLSSVERDERPFAFSTPRLEEPDRVALRRPFAHEGIDALFQARRQPACVAGLREALGVEPGQQPLFESFFTDEAPPPPPSFDGEGVRVRYFGHACLLVETDRVSILTDPVISYAFPGQSFRYTYHDLPESIDYVLVTHAHADHFMLESLLQLRGRVRNVVVPRSGGGALQDPSLKQVLLNTGFKSVIEVGELESVPVEGGDIVALPFLGEHADLDIRTKAAHLIRLKGRSVLCAADSANLEPRLYELLREAVGGVEALFLGMECDGAPLSWIYGPLLMKPVARAMDRSRKLSGSDCRQALEIVERVGCRRVYVYAMGLEPWLRHLTSLVYRPDSKQIVESDRLVAGCRQRGLESERLCGSKEIVL